MKRIRRLSIHLDTQEAIKIREERKQLCFVKNAVRK